MTLHKIGPILSYSATYISIGASLTSSIVLARILTPEEIGVSSVSFALIALANLFRDLGLANFIHTARDLSNAAFRSCLGVSMIIGATLAGLIGIASLLLASFSSDPRIAKATLALSLNFLLIPPQAIVFALLVRGGKHLSVFLGITSAAILNLFFSWWFASNGFSYLSAPFSSITSSFIGVFIVYYLRDRNYEIRPLLSHAREVTSISIHPFIGGVSKTGTERTPELSMAYFNSGLDNVAYYEKAASATELGRRLIFDSIAQIFIPILRKSGENDIEFRRAAADYLSLASILGLPVTIGLLIGAEPLIIILFGEQWLHTVPTLRILALSIPAVFITATISQLAFFRGHHVELSRLLIPIRIIEIVAICVATKHGASWIAPTVVLSEWTLSSALLIIFSKTYSRQRLAVQSLIGFAIALLSTPGAIYLAWAFKISDQPMPTRLAAPAIALAFVWLIFSAPAFVSWRRRNRSNQI